MPIKKSLSLLIIVMITFGFTQKQKTWVAIGDSITYLNDHQDETGNRVTKGYMTLVKEKTPGLAFINQGHNGWTSGGIADKIAELGIVPADVYSIFLGTNDWWQGRPIGTLEDYKNNNGNSTISGSFRIIIDKLKSLNPSAKIILITPLQRSDFVYINNYKNNAFGSYKEKNNQSLKDVAAAIAAIANSEKFKLVDLYNKSGITQQNMINFKRLKDPSTGAYKDYRYPSFINVPFDPEKDDYPYPAGAVNMTYDGLHPSDKGYAVIAKMVMQAMK